MGKDYSITRNKFFDTKEKNAIIENTRNMALRDSKKGNSTWVKRWMLVHLAMYSGLRVSEIAQLKISDIKLDDANPLLYVRNGKGNKKRDVYIDSELVQHLKDFIYQHELTGFLFENKQGKAYSTVALWMSFKEAIKDAGLRTDLTIHSARHSYATYLLHKSGRIDEVQRQLGHKSIGMTTLYANILPEERGRIANMINE